MVSIFAMFYIIPAAGFILGIWMLFYQQIPDRKVPSQIDWALVETNYGTQMDALAATLEIESPEELERERERVRDIFENDPVVAIVKFGDGRFEGSSSARTFFSRLTAEQNSSVACSSLGDGKYSNDRL